MGDRPKAGLQATSLHTSLLQEVLGSNASASLLYNYGRSFNGFAVELTKDEMLRVSAMKGVVSVFPRGKKQLHTTRSWDFMGFPQQLNRTTVESDIIIGVLDTGIWPDSDSFSDIGFGPPPIKWKGTCQTSNFTCNNLHLMQGISINSFDLKNVSYPMIYGGDAANTTGGFTGSTSRYCGEDSLDPTLVNNKIVLCDTLNSGKPALLAGAAGILMQDGGDKDVAHSFPLPASYLSLNDGSSISIYINTTGNPSATILRSNEATDTLAPYVASFSSRGPNPITRDILKPDLTAPGVDILAAWSPLSSVSEMKEDIRRVPYNIVSGTSMACPHVAGVAAYIKSNHPSWSPAAIKSALMTTASPMSITTSPDAEFAFGAGHINPTKAVNPGLVYDANQLDYMMFLCGQGYSTTLLQLVTGDTSNCSGATNGTVWDLNLPSFALSTLPSQSVSRNFSRTVTNVGLPICTYNATILAPNTLNIHVEPSVLTFSSIGQKLSFVLMVQGTTGSASLVWNDGMHQVKSPIVVYAST
ncbi:hypothetical protein RJ639_039954 [Escallonia herrerae]|uniref:Cucumisin n=1 Tax=Escallonia herrerae TaxID=1293975 RepID=A0AA88WIP8_9ASTE|nr:hypothetical protein RJ639_039954 [Escallonia herrerae]